MNLIKIVYFSSTDKYMAVGDSYIREVPGDWVKTIINSFNEILPETKLSYRIWERVS